MNFKQINKLILQKKVSNCVFNEWKAKMDSITLFCKPRNTDGFGDLNC